MSLGISFVICCHNSSERLPQVLAHLAAQKLDSDVNWEVIVIDNASTDGTAKVAQDRWPQDNPTPIRVLIEPRLGLSYARALGLNEAANQLVCFVDDDNWLCPEYAEIAVEVMTKNPQVGICGGFIEAACEAAPPPWFERYRSGYAPGAQGPEKGGDVTSRGFVMGAGLVIRKSAWEEISNNGWSPLLVDRQGTALTAGGDHELCLAVCLAGWRLWYEPRLRLQHFLPAQRLKWDLLRRQARGAGKCEAGLDPYRFAILEQNREHLSLGKEIKKKWLWEVIVALRYLVRRPIRLLLSFYFPREGDHHVIWIERQIGRFLGLIEMRNTYSFNLRQVQEASWTKTSKYYT